MDNAEFNFRLRNKLTPYRACDDPECGYAWAYRLNGARVAHYHYHYVAELPPVPPPTKETP